jgi:outer membrane protein TolC
LDRNAVRSTDLTERFCRAAYFPTVTLSAAAGFETVMFASRFTKDGSGKRYRTEIVARQIRFLGRRADAAGKPASSEAPF